ncbi:hypothetical protein [Actibacterium sp. D379-3]
MYLLVFIRNLLVHLAEKILLMQPLTFGGDYRAINHGGPKTIWKAPAIKTLAEEFGLFYFDGAETMGPVLYIPPRPAPEQ